MLARHTGPINPGDEILRILGGKIIHAGVILARHPKLMDPGDEILRILGGKIHPEHDQGTNIPTYQHTEVTIGLVTEVRQASKNP